MLTQSTFNEKCWKTTFPGGWVGGWCWAWQKQCLKIYLWGMSALNILISSRNRKFFCIYGVSLETPVLALLIEIFHFVFCSLFAVYDSKTIEFGYGYNRLWENIQCNVLRVSIQRNKKMYGIFPNGDPWVCMWVYLCVCGQKCKIQCNFF